MHAVLDAVEPAAWGQTETQQAFRLLLIFSVDKAPKVYQLGSCCRHPR